MLSDFQRDVDRQLKALGELWDQFVHQLKLLWNHVPGPLLVAVIGLAVVLDYLRRSWPKPQARRVDPVNEVAINLGCTRAQAETLVKEYSGDSTRVILDVRRGKRDLPAHEGSQEGFAVVLGPDERKELVPMAKLLAQVWEHSQQEALAQLSPAPGGLLARNLEEPVAEKFRDALIERGQKAMVVPVGELPQPMLVGDLQSMLLDAESLRLEIKNGLAEQFLWDDVRAICVGVFNPESRPNPDGSILASRGRLVAHLYTRGDGFRRYVLEARSFNYAYLGDRRRESGTMNFQVLLRELLEHCPHCAVNQSARMFLAELKCMVYKSDSDLVADGLSRLLWAES